MVTGSNECDSERGAVVSDLHLFTNRTTVHEHIDDIRRAADECDLFVFNGDIFDFKWSRHGGFALSVHAAEEWIRRLVAAHPETAFVFLLGNHDSVPAYRETLDGLAREFSNLDWRADWYRRGGRLFLHGDVSHPLASRRGLRVYRDRCNRTLQRSRFHHACYWVFARSGLPAFFLRFVSREKCARRILAYLRRELGGDLDEISDIYFGHVHTPFSDFSHGGFSFHNTGSATRGFRLSVIRFGDGEDR